MGRWPVQSLSACTVDLYLYSPYGLYGLYRASVPHSRAIPLLPLWAVRPVQSLSACTRVHFTFYFYMYQHTNTLQISKLYIIFNPPPLHSAINRHYQGDVIAKKHLILIHKSYMYTEWLTTLCSHVYASTMRGMNNSPIKVYKCTKFRTNLHGVVSHKTVIFIFTTA
jgi:hypothetical protein